MSETTPTDTSGADETVDRRYRGASSIRLGEEDRQKLLALIDEDIVPDLATMVRRSIQEHYERMRAREGAVWPEAVIPALLLAPAANGAPYTCPFTDEVLIGRVGLALLPGLVLGPYVSARFLTDETLLRPGAAAAEEPGPAQVGAPTSGAVVTAAGREDGTDAGA